MMQFRVIRDKLIEVLGAAAAGNFRVIGFQKQTKNAEEVKGNNRSLQVYYSTGDFSKKGGRMTGSPQHDMVFRLEFTVSEPAKVDLSVIENPGSTALQIANALAALQTASKLANDSMDEFFEIVYQILMDANNVTLGLPADAEGKENAMANRWIPDFRKDETLEKGELVVLTGIAMYACRSDEAVVGASAVPGLKTIDTTVDNDGDNADQAGATTQEVA